MKTLLQIIDTAGEPDIISQILFKNNPFKNSMFLTKKVNIFISLTEIKESIRQINKDTEFQLAEIIQAVKEKNAELTEIAEAALKKKHLKKITKKAYLHCPTNTAMDEIAKKDLQELIYQLGIEEIASILKIALQQNQN